MNESFDLLQQHVDEIHYWRVNTENRIDQMILDRLLEYCESYSNYNHYQHSTGGFFELDGKKVLRYKKVISSTSEGTLINYKINYEVYDYIANEYLYFEEE